jgi:hypothetical protein
MEPSSKRPTLGLSCWCPPGIRMELVVGLPCSSFSYFCFDCKKRCHGDRSHTSLVLIARWSLAHPMTSLSLPAMALLTVSTGALTVVTSDLLWSVVSLVPGVSSAGGTS